MQSSICIKIEFAKIILFSHIFRTLFLTLPLVIFTVSVAALAGIVIFANYAGCDPISLGLISRNDQVTPHFVLEYLSPISGLLGLFISCLFSASLRYKNFRIKNKGIFPKFSNFSENLPARYPPESTQ